MQKYAGQEKYAFFKAGSGSGISGFKILICRIRIRPKMDRIRNPVCNIPHLQVGIQIYFASPVRYLATLVSAKVELDKV